MPPRRLDTLTIPPVVAYSPTIVGSDTSASSPDTRMARALVVALADDRRTLDTEGWSVSEPRLRVMLARTASQASEILAMLERMASELEGG